MTVVTFNVDHTPYCKGDTVDLDKEQLAAVDAEAERRGVRDTYSKGEVATEESAPAVSTVNLAEEQRQAEYNAQAKAERAEREAVREEAASEVEAEGAVELPTVEEPELKAKQAKGKK